jgi:FAD/FMN-containing dehydrogenase
LNHDSNHDLGNSPARASNIAGVRPLIPSDHQGFDRRWYAHHLQAVFVPGRPDQVAPCVAQAIARWGKHVKVTSGRHCYENFVYNDSTQAIIDMSALNQAGYDDAHKAYFIDAGCENWSAYRTLLNSFGKTLPAGSCYSVGAGGHITGGGYGLLSRLHGLTIDHLSAVDIVTWDAMAQSATLRHVSAASRDPAEQDLFWALKGAGGGNFGVIVRYYFASLPDAPDFATLCTFAWNWSDIGSETFAALLALYFDVVQQLPETDFTLLKLNHVANGQIGMIVQMASSPGVSRAEHCLQAEARLANLKQRFDAILPAAELKKPLGGHPGQMHTVHKTFSAQHLTYLEALQTLNGSGPNQFGKYKSAYMKKAFPPEQAASIYQWLHTTPKNADGDDWDMSQCLLQVDSYGGAINRVAADATAVPQRSSIMKLQYQAYWNNDAEPGRAQLPRHQEQLNAYLNWINYFYCDVYAAYGGTPNPANDRSGTVDGCYYNYPDEALGTHKDGKIGQAMQLYFLDNYRTNARNLVRIKRYWDPQNFFHHPQSIPLS